MRPLARLRWQLILSHFKAIVFTLVSMVAAVVLIAGSWIGSQQDRRDEPAQQARVVANAIGGLVARGDASGDLNVVLRALVSGDLRVQEGGPPFEHEHAQQYSQFWSSLRDLAYVVIIAPDGQPIASSEPAGSAFAPSEHQEWQELARTAMSGARDPSQLVVVRSGDGPAALGAYPVLDERGRPTAAVVVATSTLSPADHQSGFWGGPVFFGAASVAILAAASVFALASASVVGYLLSRKLVVRLERLGQGVESLAAGDLSRRVDEGPSDEVGQLARRFNYMADRLAATVAELEAARTRTEATLRAKRELVANVSHELRTPLALIRGHVDSLLIRGVDADRERQREYLAVLQRETEHLSRLIDDLFTLSTAEADALSLKLAPVALGEVVEEIVASVRPIARREHQITIGASVDSDLPPVLADRQRVMQVLGNLVRNALRHTREGGLVAVQVERRDGHALVTVEDTGEGIPPDRLPHVFERFYRGDDARDRASGGAGLGLAIVRELVEAMGGDVSVESIVGQGTRFSFRLPLVADANGAGIEADETAPPATTSAS